MAVFCFVIFLYPAIELLASQWSIYHSCIELLRQSIHEFKVPWFFTFLAPVPSYLTEFFFFFWFIDYKNTFINQVKKNGLK